MAACSQFEELISPFLDGELNRKESRRMAQHLSSCPECRAELERLEELGSAIYLTRSEFSFIPPGFKDSVMEKIRGELQVTPPPFHPLAFIRSFTTLILRPAYLATALAGLLIIGGLGAYLWWSSPHRPEPSRFAQQTHRPEVFSSDSLDIYLYQHRSQTRENALFPIQSANYNPHLISQ